ncbi:ketoacyl-ACP synthase III [Hymenobacter taeanensis]|uniref:Ketoacyl-ACP synthase III n=1 Tax=Hymenobacter taeanensis TaxID=2735321 RepID=A0A6M6BDZ2_9BACT|nr:MULTISPECIES: ketoacyl-ACP synthase III [Hymenobacter]QJX46761.1 ketoacyl-ACP synthase III [Hymenobacter taeanensis]UOQ80629.1 ketoacyl-ACP synthase III [Hymenobacter sp. 5414T-23]
MINNPRIYSVIVGSGSYIPPSIVTNQDFSTTEFYDSSGARLQKPSAEIVEKFEQITDIQARRYVTEDQVTSDIAFLAAQDALTSSGIDQEELDYIIVAHNFGDVPAHNKRTDMVPSLAARVKHKLGIVNPYTVAYDLPFGCPGWLQAVIQADYFLRSGDAKKILVIGAEVLSRVSDPHDRDSMLYADGAGAVILQGVESTEPVGIITHTTRSDTERAAHLLRMGSSYNAEYAGTDQFLKMDGRKLYEYALKTVPQAIKACLEKAQVPLAEVHKILIHQANGKMDEAILKRLYSLYDIQAVPQDVMPMTISWLGNSSVATLPTLLDLMLNDKMDNHEINDGDTLVFASVGAGMNINAVVYKMPA